MSLELDPQETEASFLRSALCLENRFQPLSEVRAWLRAKQTAGRYRIDRVPLEELDRWSFEPGSGDLVHASGKFFRIEGLRCATNFPTCPPRWEQPIINQPEVGLLGMLTRVVDGVRYFLVQAKFEPGNVNLVQLSPTLQATRSNFTRVHQGNAPRYLERFLDPDARVLVDQLQSEQGARFLRKRNRNIIIELDEELEPHEDFRWLTIGELKQLLDEDDLVNMDARTVLSCVPFVSGATRWRLADQTPDAVGRLRPFGHELSGFARDLFVSQCDLTRRRHGGDEIISWFTRLKTSYSLDVSYVPLREVEGWRHAEGVIRHETTNHFSVVGLDVAAAEREVPSWQQPILLHEGLGLVGFLAQRFEGVLHLLVQAKVEPGIFDIVEMGPTVSLWDIDRRARAPDEVPFLRWFLDPPADRVRLDAIQSEEGGRLYHLRNRYTVVEVPEGERLELPPNFIWMTLAQLLGFVRYNNYVNIEARGLLSALPLHEPSTP